MVTAAQSSVQCNWNQFPLYTVLQTPVVTDINDSNSLFVIALQLIHLALVDIHLTSVSSGSVNSPFKVSMRIPKSVMTVEGPSVFWSAIGTPSSLQYQVYGVPFASKLFASPDSNNMDDNPNDPKA